MHHSANRAATKVAQGWSKLWANFRALIGIFSQSIKFWPSLAIFGHPIYRQFSIADDRGLTAANNHACTKEDGWNQREVDELAEQTAESPRGGGGADGTVVSSRGRRCHSTLSLTVIGCHSLGIYTVILLPLLSFSFK
jgi:hypothetical protein